MKIQLELMEFVLNVQNNLTVSSHFFVSFFSSGDKPAAMKHSNKSTSIDEKSTGALLRGYQISYSILGNVIVTAVTRILLNS